MEKRIGSESEGKKAREEEEGSKEKGTRWKYHWVIAHCAPSPAVFTVFSLRQSFQQLLNRSRTGIISFREKPLLFLLHPLVPLSVIILLIIISIRDGSKYYTFVSNSLINQISLWRGYDFLARSDRWKREEIEITLLLIPGAVSDSPLLLILPFQIPREPKITRNLRRLEEFFLPVCVKKKGERRGKISGNKFRSISLYVSWISRNNGEREGRKEEKKERRVARESCCS